MAAAAAAVHVVPSGQVPELAATLVETAASESLVAFGGGRPIDVAKAVAAVTGARVAAIPTTLSGAEMTGIHRLPAGAESRVASMVRPALVVADPVAMTSQPEAALRASAMNALAHGADSLYTPFANPVSEMSALRGAELIATALDQDPGERNPAALALGSLLCGYAIDSAVARPPPRRSARPWSASAAAPTRRPTRRSCRGRWRCWSPGRRIGSPTSPPRSRPTPKTSKPASSSSAATPPASARSAPTAPSSTRRWSRWSSAPSWPSSPARRSARADLAELVEAAW